MWEYKNGRAQMLETVFVLPLLLYIFWQQVSSFSKQYIYILNTMCFFAVSSILLRHLSYHPSIWSGQKRRRQMQIKVSKLELCFVSVMEFHVLMKRGEKFIVWRIPHWLINLVVLLFCRYGKYWKLYCEKVPYRIIPGIYWYVALLPHVKPTFFL